MSKWTVFRTTLQSTVVEADDADHAKQVAREYKGGWSNSDDHSTTSRSPEPYAPKPIDWDAVGKLPKPKYSADELQAIMRPPETKLFYCPGNDDNGDDLSLFVEATTPEEALTLYKKFLVDNGWNEPDDTYRVFAVPPLAGRPCVYNYFLDQEGNGAPVLEELLSEAV